MGAQRTILVVEDNDFVRLQIVSFLKEAGYDTREATDGNAAIDAMNKDITLAVVDVRMEPMGGFDYISMIRAEGYKTPVVLVTGDEAVCRESRELLGDGLTTVAVKQGLGRESARNIAPQRARQMIEDGAKRALGDLMAVAPFDPGHPCEIEVDLMGSHLVEPYRARHGVEIVSGRGIVSRADDWWTAWRQFWPMP